MKFTYSIIAALSVIALPSCSLFSPSHSKTVTGNSGMVVSYDTKKAESDKEVKSIADRLDGEWVIINVNGQKVDGTDDMPYITFQPSTGRFYASDGCNIINGSYTISANNRLTAENVISTMKMCPETAWQLPIATALSGAAPLDLRISDVGQESFLQFFNDKGTELMSARRHNMDFLNGNWQITAVNGQSVDTDEATLFIDINELKIHGNTGCNFFNGDVYIAPDRINAVDFSNIGSTRMACPDMQRESAILLALEETASAIRGSEGNVMLLDSNGKELMTLRSIPMTDRQ